MVQKTTTGFEKEMGRVELNPWRNIEWIGVGDPGKAWIYSSLGFGDV